jgi:hypothetical protein
MLLTMPEIPSIFMIQSPTDFSVENISDFVICSSTEITDDQLANSACELLRFYPEDGRCAAAHSCGFS